MQGNNFNPQKRTMPKSRTICLLILGLGTGFELKLRNSATFALNANIKFYIST